MSVAPSNYVAPHSTLDGILAALNVDRTWPSGNARETFFMTPRASTRTNLTDLAGHPSRLSTRSSDRENGCTPIGLVATRSEGWRRAVRLCVGSMALPAAAMTSWGRRAGARCSSWAQLQRGQAGPSLSSWIRERAARRRHDLRSRGGGTEKLKSSSYRTVIYLKITSIS